MSNGNEQTDSEIVKEHQSDLYEKIKRLSDSELEELWMSYLSDRTNKVLRDKLIVQYIYLTKFVINRIKVKLTPTMSWDDIKSFGIEGLMDAIERFSPEKGGRFETYAIMRIKGNIIDKIRANDWMPRSTRQRIRILEQTTEELKQELKRMPTNSEIAVRMGTTVPKVAMLQIEDSNITSIYDKRYSGDESIELIETLSDGHAVNPIEQLAEEDVKNVLQYALAKLPERERMVMVLYYRENMTLKEIGESINVSESRVCQIHAGGIVKLRNLLAEFRRKHSV